MPPKISVAEPGINYDISPSCGGITVTTTVVIAKCVTDELPAGDRIGADLVLTFRQIIEPIRVGGNSLRVATRCAADILDGRTSCRGVTIVARPDFIPNDRTGSGRNWRELPP